MNILITGCRGQLGNEMQLLEKSHSAHTYFNTDVQIFPDERNHPSVLDLPSEYFHQFVLIDGIEELFKVHVHRPCISLAGILQTFPDGMRSVPV